MVVRTWRMVLSMSAIVSAKRSLLRDAEGSAEMLWSDRPIANNRWMTVSCRSRASRSPPHSRLIVGPDHGAERSRWQCRR